MNTPNSNQLLSVQALPPQNLNFFSPASRERIPSLDLMRGLVMVLMTLEHVRGSMAWQAVQAFGNASPLGPVDPTASFPDTPGLFFTLRWISNLCAPVFIFLAGASIFLWRTKKGADAPVSQYLIVRGSILIFINFLIKTSAPFSGNPYFDLDVLWPIGVAMVIIGLSIKLPAAVLWCLGLVIVFGHNLFTPQSFAGLPCQEFWSLAFFQSTFQLPWGGSVLVRYPFLTWYGVMLLGYLSGALFLSTQNRLKHFCVIAIGMMVTFFILRYTQLYGDPKPWLYYEEAWKTVASFLNTTKYPPSLLFLLFNLSLMFFFIAVMDKYNLNSKLLLTLGRTPIFFYVTHYIIARGSAKAIAIYHGPFADDVKNLAFSIPGIIIGTVGITIFLYPFCVWWMQRRSKNSGPLPGSTTRVD